MSKIAPYDCAIIGAGPAGMVCALYLQRFQRRVVLFDHGKPRAAWIPKTHNLMGFYRGVSGRDLLKQLRKQIKVQVVRENARVERHGSDFLIHAGHKKFHARKVILATGIEDIQPKAENLDQLRRSGLLRYCPVCDAFEHRHSELGLLVSNEECARKALFLRHHTRRLTVIIPNHASLSAARRRQLRKMGVTCRQGDVENIVANKKKNGLYVSLTNGDSLPFDAVYVELGIRVRDEAFRKIRGIKRTKLGLLRTNGEQRVSVPGLFAVGDCVNSLAQISVGAGEAAVAATTVHNDLLDEEA